MEYTCTGFGPTATRDTTWEGQHTRQETVSRKNVKAAHWRVKQGARPQPGSHFEICSRVEPVNRSQTTGLLPRLQVCTCLVNTAQVKGARHQWLLHCAFLGGHSSWKTERTQVQAAGSRQLNVLTSCWLASRIITYEWLPALELTAGWPGYRSPVVTKTHWSSPSYSQTSLVMQHAVVHEIFWGGRGGRGGGCPSCMGAP